MKLNTFLHGKTRSRSTLMVVLVQRKVSLKQVPLQFASVCLEIITALLYKHYDIYIGICNHIPWHKYNLPLHPQHPNIINKPHLTITNTLHTSKHKNVRLAHIKRKTHTHIPLDHKEDKQTNTNDITFNQHVRDTDNQSTVSYRSSTWSN